MLRAHLKHNKPINPLLYSPIQSVSNSSRCHLSYAHWKWSNGIERNDDSATTTNANDSIKCEQCIGRSRWNWILCFSLLCYAIRHCCCCTIFLALGIRGTFCMQFKAKPFVHMRAFDNKIHVGPLVASNLNGSLNRRQNVKRKLSCFSMDLDYGLCCIGHWHMHGDCISQKRRMQTNRVQHILCIRVHHESSTNELNIKSWLECQTHEKLQRLTKFCEQNEAPGRCVCAAKTWTRWKCADCIRMGHLCV